MPLIDKASAMLGRPLRFLDYLGGGHEATIVLVDSGDARLVLHVDPPWRSTEELDWVHNVLSFVGKSIPEAVTPIPVADRTYFRYNKNLVSVFPFIEGDLLDVNDRALREQAGTLLARIHKHLIDWHGPARPVPVIDERRSPLPPPLSDRDLDDWWNAQSAQLTGGMNHGDFYRSNIICKNGKITGVIDWGDASVRPLLLELAGAAFEFSRDENHDLDVQQVREFVLSYRTGGGPIPDREFEHLLACMRIWIREDACGSLASDGPNDYARRQIQAFQNLGALDLGL